MRSLVEAVANVVLFILAPVALVWVQSRLAMVIETLLSPSLHPDGCHNKYSFGGMPFHDQ